MDYVDAIGVDVPSGASAPEFCEQVLTRTPRWVTALLGVRDAVMGPFGYQTQTRVAPGEGRIESGRKLGPLVVLSVDDDEVLLGDDDKHLSFRTSFAVRDTDAGREGVCTTSIRFHNRFGRCYFGVIRPLHNLVLPALIARAD